MEVLVLADAEDRDDVAVPEIGGRPGLAEETLHRAVVGPGGAGEHVDRDAAAQRLLLGLVHDAHAAPADLADEPAIADPPGLRRAAAGPFAARARVRLPALHGGDGREQGADLLRPFRASCG